MLNKAQTEPTDDEFHSEREIARVAWLYFVGGMTQKDIATELGTTRLRINKMIGQVRASGLVNIEVRSPLADCVALEERLKAKFHLKGAVVVPALTDPIEQQRTIGEAAGELLNSVIAGRDLGVGIGWGRTLAFATRRLEVKSNSHSWVVGLMGGVTRASLTNTFEVAMSVAKALGLECHYLTAPIYCSSPESLEAILHNDEIADVLARTEIADVALVACGDLHERSPIPSLRVVKDSLDELERLGAVGEILGYFLRANGELVDHQLNRSIMAIPLEALREKPVSVLASGGLYKAPIIRATLNGRYVNHLVTDEAVARVLLSEL
ncbi:sugar-binding transcriptional regulator [Mesorhizobium sp. RP14(2022)]|uniref:Sugar-binding transcriptional regulator n=1 Tax=Mesorhizobium liriopis TaxID=2953882 RepID=A0ABT1C679_9HYPH|nr:sugar-binding transcriptional regulator [Mesorhizobium liriopis]